MKIPVDPGSTPGRRILIKMTASEKFEKLYDKNYKKLLFIPAILLIISLAYIGYFYSINQDFIKKDVSLTGGTTITIFPEQEINIQELTQHISKNIEDFSIRELSDFKTGKQKAIIIESPITDTSSKEYSSLIDSLETFLGYELISGENFDVVSTGSSLGESFYKQLRFAFILAFIFMALVVFFIFRTMAPSTAVIISAFADIVMTLAFVNFLGMKVSSAGIMAFLMLIGYSVDTDIMLTTRLLKRQEKINHRLLNAFKTGITMTITSIIAITVALFIVKSFSIVLGQIFTILIIGLSFDIINTWITNASILKWYVENRK